MDGAPSARAAHTAVWTGNEMVVWGGDGFGGIRRDGGRYDPATDSWRATSDVDAPIGRFYHSAVWTGAEMIVWGGATGWDPTASGARYAVDDDAWHPISTDGAPAARLFHVAFWTGDEMIVWGGVGGSPDAVEYFVDGGRYDPATDSWELMAPVDPPVPDRLWPVAVWTGTELAVWGAGLDAAGELVFAGRRYSPALDRWAAMSGGAPRELVDPATVWTGEEMIVFGEYRIIDVVGGRYDPEADTWSTMSVAGAPPPTWEQTAVWTGEHMIVWGGFAYNGEQARFMSVGGMYDPVANTWAWTPGTAVEPRTQHTAVWTGDEMIVWGGYGETDYFATGGRFTPP
jgi:N-acetylneuraminic acid mutarotase